MRFPTINPGISNCIVFCIGLFFLEPHVRTRNLHSCLPNPPPRLAAIKAERERRRAGRPPRVPDGDLDEIKAMYAFLSKGNRQKVREMGDAVGHWSFRYQHFT